MSPFEITDDDIKSVLRKYGVAAEGEAFAPFDDAVDREQAENAALGADVEDDDDDTMSNQVDAAARDITVQLVTSELLPLSAVLATADQGMRVLLESAGVELPTKRGLRP